MLRRLFVFLFAVSTACAAQSNPDRALLERMRPLYDTPFRHGLISFDCAIDFDFKQHVVANVGSVERAPESLVSALEPLRYRVFVDRTGAIVSAQPKLPDLSAIPNATVVEDSDRQLMQVGLNNWTPHADGEILPLGPTKYQFEKTPSGYKLSMQGENLDAVLTIDADLDILSGVVEKPMHIDMTTEFASGPHGLVLSKASTNTNHLGTVKYAYTYQAIDGFQIPEAISLTSPQNATLDYKLTDCKTQHGIVVKVQPAQH